MDDRQDWEDAKCCIEYNDFENWVEDMQCAKEEDDTPGQDRAGEKGEDS